MDRDWTDDEPKVKKRTQGNYLCEKSFPKIWWNEKKAVPLRRFS